VGLHKLELYDNYIKALVGLENLSNLKILDMSFNAVRDMSPVAACPLLEELYLAQNKLRKIQGIRELKHLRILDLGANRIRVSCWKYILVLHAGFMSSFYILNLYVSCR
jgi:protein phosphatase 1 regulatory subunit 7